MSDSAVAVGAMSTAQFIAMMYGYSKYSLSRSLTLSLTHSQFPVSFTALRIFPHNLGLLLLLHNPNSPHFFLLCKSFCHLWWLAAMEPERVSAVPKFVHSELRRISGFLEVFGIRQIEHLFFLPHCLLHRTGILILETLFAQTVQWKIRTPPQDLINYLVQQESMILLPNQSWVASLFDGVRKASRATLRLISGLVQGLSTCPFLALVQVHLNRNNLMWGPAIPGKPPRPPKSHFHDHCSWKSLLSQ